MYEKGMSDVAREWFNEYKEFIRDEYGDDDVHFNEDGYLGLAYTTTGANEDFQIQVSYSPSKQSLKIEIWSEDLSVTEERNVEVENAYCYLDFDYCYHIGNNLVEKFVGEDFEW